MKSWHTVLAGLHHRETAPSLAPLVLDTFHVFYYSAMKSNVEHLDTDLDSQTSFCTLSQSELPQNVFGLS